MLPIKLEIFSSFFVFSMNSEEVNEKSNHLIIFRSHPISCKFVDNISYTNFLESESLEKQVQIYGIIGIINLEDMPYLGVIISANEIGKIKIHPIYQVLEVKFLPFKKIKETKSPILKEIQKWLTLGNYFSYSYDLTSSFQRATNMLRKYPDQKTQKDKRYVINFFMILPIIENHISEPWILCLIQGYIGIFVTEIPFHIEFILISRRKAAMVGTLETSRGLDDE